MNRMFIVVAGVVAFLSGAQDASAFSTQPVDPATISNRLADPAELADRMSNGQSGGTTFGLPQWPPEASVFRTIVGREREQPICDEPEYGIRAERTSVIRGVPSRSTCGKFTPCRS